MSADRYVRLDLTTGRLAQATPAQTGGAGQANKIIALGADGLISPTMLPSVGVATVQCTADVNLAAGDFVNIFFSSAVRRARKATAVDATANAQGYVLDTVTATNTVTVYLDGLNSMIPRGAITTANIGSRVFLSTTGGLITLNAPSTAGNVVQFLGVIVSVDTGTNLVGVSTEFTDGIVV